MTTLCHNQLYQRCLEKEFDKKVRPRTFQEGDLVLNKILPIHKDSMGKWTQNYEGPFIVVRALSRGALILANMDGGELPLHTNVDVVKRYFT